MIKFNPAPIVPEELIFERLLSDDGKIFMGIHTVMFGYRVRAGYVGQICYELDWCGGADQTQVELLYSIAKNILENKGSFAGIPDRSEIKPFYNDPAFVAKITAMVTQPLHIVKLKPLNVSRAKIFKQNSNLQKFI